MFMLVIKVQRNLKNNKTKFIENIVIIIKDPCIGHIAHFTSLYVELMLQKKDLKEKVII